MASRLLEERVMCGGARADLYRSEITCPLQRLVGESRSAFPTRKVRLGELGRGAAQSSGEGDPRDADADLQCSGMAL